MYVVDYKDNNKNDVDDLVGYKVSHHPCMKGFFCLFSPASDVLTPVLRHSFFLHEIWAQRDCENQWQKWWWKLQVNIFLQRDFSHKLSLCVLCSHLEHVVRIGETKHTSFKKGLSIFHFSNN